MDHSYQLSRPSIETIIDYCNDLLADEELTVFEFGENCDLVLHIYKDEEFNPPWIKTIPTLLPSIQRRMVNGSMIPKMYMSRTVLYTENWSGSTAIQTWVHYKNLVLHERKQNYEIQK